MQEVIRHPMTIAIWMSIVTFGVPLFMLHLTRKHNGTRETKDALKEKVDVEDCRDVQKRI